MPQPDQFTWNDFSGGWQPSSDDVNGPKNALLQMDNVELDKNGALTLAGATSIIRTYANNAVELYSNIVNSTRHDYVADDQGQCFRDATSLFTGGDVENVAFSQAFDYTLIASGTKRKKDTGTTLFDLGIETPATAPVISVGGTGGAYLVPRVHYNNAAATGTPGSVNLVQQIAAGGGVSFVDDGAITFALVGEGGILVTLIPVTQPVDMTTLNPTVGFGTSMTDRDILYVPFFRDPAITTPFSNLTSITFQFWLNAVTSNPTDYYSWTWLNDGTMGTIPNPRRSDFTRYGSGSKGWESVQVYAFLFLGSAATNNFKFLTEPRFYGGLKGSQDGTYEYMQVNVSTNGGKYISKSGMSPVSAPITLTMQPAGIVGVVPTDTQVDQAWIYRRGGQLGQWYRVLVITSPWFPFKDTLSDQDALTLGITFDLNLIPVSSSTLPDKIFAIVGPIEGRWYYFTTNFMYPSDINDPDLVNPALGIRTTGSDSEVFLSARKVSDSSVIVLTSRDAYLLTGTYQTLPDGTIDLYYRGLGCKFPAISHDSSYKEGVIFYLASDGWRSLDTNGNTVLLVSTLTDRLYRGITSYGYSVNTKIAPGHTRFPCVLALNKLWCGIAGQSRFEVLDTLRSYWRNVNIGHGNLTAICSTQDGQVLGFFDGDKSLRILDYHGGVTSQVVQVLSPVFDGGTPTRRHEFYTIKVRLQTGAGENLTIQVKLDNSTTVTVGTVASVGAVTEQFLYFSVDEGIPLTKFWQYILTGTFTILTLNDLEIDYDTRPIQTSHIHLLPDNFGVVGRKRIPTIPFVIDTLGVTVAFTPIVDGTPLTTLNISSSRKQSFSYESTTDIVGVDWEFKLQTELGLFEWFGLTTPQYVEKLPDPAQYHWIPVSNLGSPNKKRVRVWPFLLDPLGNSVTFNPIVDGATTATTTFTGGKKTYFHFFKTDEFGVDYSGFFSGGPFELYQIMAPDIVQILPIARQFDQVGPEELFRYGTIKQFELRVLPFGTSIPWTMYFNDNTTKTGAITCISGLEQSYFVGLPLGAGGQIVRIELGPTSFNFHRFYIRLQVRKSGQDTDLTWITLPDPAAGE